MVGRALSIHGALSARAWVYFLEELAFAQSHVSFINEGTDARYYVTGLGGCAGFS
jgi:hypothetical protein